VVRRAIEAVPEEFQHALSNVAIVVLEEPDPEDLCHLDIDSTSDELFGLYQGVPLTERGRTHSGLPDRIEIYRGPILRSFDSPERIELEIRDTLIHELGHHMGLNDDEMAY
jgi:predicted Zn-dependent protease with MMP-like domain